MNHNWLCLDRLPLLLSTGSLAVALAGEATPAPSRLECFTTSDLIRVFDDGYGPPESRLRSLDLFGLRNEIVSAQCVVVAHEDLDGLAVSLIPLKQAEGSGVIPTEHLRWNFIGSIFIATNSPNQRAQHLVRPAPAWFPDYLGEEPRCSLRKGMRKAVYLTINIPRDAAAGEYVGLVTFSAGKDLATLPLSLKVYPLTLPDARHVSATTLEEGGNSFPLTSSRCPVIGRLLASTRRPRRCRGRLSSGGGR